MDSLPLKLANRGVQRQKIDYYNTECYGKMQKGIPTQITVPFYSSLFTGPDLYGLVLTFYGRTSTLITLLRCKLS